MVLLINFQNVKKTYKKNIDALKEVTFHIEMGEFVFLIGPSGAGKSTVLRLLLKETEPDGGRIYFKGEDITKVRKRRIPQIRKSIGVVFQDFRLLEDKTVYQNIKYAMEILGASHRLMKRRISEVLDLVDLSHKKKSYPHELSGGEQQRLCIARAMVNRPDILIADEPTGNLDPDTSWDIINTLLKINEQGTTILMITHAEDIVNKLERRVIELEKGEVVRDIEGGKYHA